MPSKWPAGCSEVYVEVRSLRQGTESLGSIPTVGLGPMPIEQAAVSGLVSVGGAEHMRRRYDVTWDER